MSVLTEIIDLLRAQDADGRDGVDWKMVDVVAGMSWDSVLYANEDRSIVVKARPEVYHPDGHRRGAILESEWLAFDFDLENVLEDLVGNERWETLRWLRDEIDGELARASQ